MNRPDMEQIKDEIRLCGKPTSKNSKAMYNYIIKLEVELEKLQKAEHNSEYKSPSAQSCKELIHPAGTQSNLNDGINRA